MGWEEKLKSARKRVNEAAEKLLELDPEHELLHLWFIQKREEGNKEAEERHQTRMKDMFWNGNGSWEDADVIDVYLVVLENYRRALKKAIRHIIREKIWEEETLPRLILKQKQKQEQQVLLLDKDAA